MTRRPVELPRACAVCGDRSVMYAAGRARCASCKTAGPNVPREEPGRLAVTCWCERTVRQIPRSLVLASQTVSCGAPDCEPAA